MAIIPILLDSRPSYLQAAGVHGSVLLLPTGAGTVAREVAEAVAAATQHRPRVMPTFEPLEDYERAIRAAAPTVFEVITADVLRDPLSRFDVADELLLVNPECYPAEGLDLRAFLRPREEAARMARHLLAFGRTPGGTQEYVQPGSDGRVRRIQRVFEPSTWALPVGVVASLIPVVCLLTDAGAPGASLAALRGTLSARGVPSEDVPVRGDFFQLGDEEGARALTERRVAELMRAHGVQMGAETEPLVVGDGALVHATARFLGPVVLGEGVEVSAGALIVGPSLLGPGAHVGEDAVVAQCLVVSDGVVRAASTVRHRVVARDDEMAERPRRHAPAALPAVAVRPRRYPAVKRWIEPVIAAVALVALLPLLIVVAILVKLTSRGPAFYGDVREGMNGRTFRCWKFRSMRPDAASMQRALAAEQQMDGPQFKMDDDPRVTTLGRWLRRLNVDELPQLFNVVRGEMSLVGPRPSPFRENQICVPWRQGRLTVRPGITGLWQVCRQDRANGDFHQWIHYDLLYVRHASAMVDLRILAATLLTLGGLRAVSLTRIIPGAATPPVPDRAGGSDAARRRVAEEHVPVGVGTPDDG